MCVNISYMDLMGNDSIRIAAFQNDSEWWPSHSRDGPTCFPQDRGGVAWKHKIRLNVWWNHLVCVICVFLSLLWFPVIHPDLGANCWLSSWSQWWCFWSYFIGIIWSPARLPGFSFASLTLRHFRFPDCWVAVVFLQGQIEGHPAQRDAQDKFVWNVVLKYLLKLWIKGT